MKNLCMNIILFIHYTCWSRILFIYFITEYFWIYLHFLTNTFYFGPQYFDAGYLLRPGIVWRELLSLARNNLMRTKYFGPE